MNNFGLLGMLLMMTQFAGQASVVLPVGQWAEPVNKKSLSADGQVMWYQASDIGLEGKGWQEAGKGTDYGRLPAKAQGTVPDIVWNLGLQCAGLCVRFVTDSRYLWVHWDLTNSVLDMPHMPSTGVSGIDLYSGDSAGKWTFVANAHPSDVKSTAKFELSGANTEYLLYLPLYNGVTQMQIGTTVGAAFSRVRFDPSIKPLVFYGTSITQGGCASRPGMATPAIIGRAIDKPIINLGFSGNGRMEPALAQLVGEIDASVYVVDCLWNMTPSLVHERTIPLVRILRTKRPTTPILLVEDSNYLDACPTPKGFILRQEYEALHRAGVANLYFLSAKGMLGTDSEGTVDGCHFTDLGMMRQAAVFLKALYPLLSTK